MIVSIKEVKAHMQELSNPKIAEHSLRFFKTGPGELRGGRVPGDSGAGHKKGRKKISGVVA